MNEQNYPAICWLSNTIVRSPIKQPVFHGKQGRFFFPFLKVRLWRQLVKLDDPEVYPGVLQEGWGGFRREETSL